jgi:putative transposase
MEGKNRWLGNGSIERVWRGGKYEDVDLRLRNTYKNTYEALAELRSGLRRYFDFYNATRRHTALARRTPDAVYCVATAAT